MKLTEDQFVVLDALGSDCRVIIEGLAGSGKTILAVEMARRSARRGDRVLLTCYNCLLADKPERTLADEFASDRVVVASLHRLFTNMIKKSSVASELEERRSSATNEEIFGNLMPELALYAALEEVIPRFDVLVIDDAQDVLNVNTIEVLSELLEHGRWWLFLDSNNQASLYGKLDDKVFDQLRDVARSQSLTVNCWNTREIAYHTTLMAQPKLASHGRVDGPPVEFVSFSSGKSPFGKLGGILVQLMKQGVSGGRVTVLLARVPSPADESKLRELSVFSVRNESIDHIGAGSARTWAVASGFKGLESDVIVLVGVEDVDEDWWRAVCHLGMSRVRTCLYVILSADCERIRRQRLEAQLESAYKGKS